MPRATSAPAVPTVPDDVACATQVAIIGLSCRFPGADEPRAFWEMLEANRDGLVEASSGDGVRRSCFSMPKRFSFDAEFFGISPAQAAVMDPQHRVFLETAWHALEDAGYGDRTSDDRTGVFAACGFNDYALRHVGLQDFRDGATDAFDMMLCNDKDYLASRAAYLLNLTGPAVLTQSACSSGLLCVHQAVQSMLQHETNMALAGAASVSVSLEDGYRPDAGGVMSPTGRIAPFSASADGIVGGNGAAVVVLKRLADALADGDHIYATILGSAANNDGAARASFTAPGVASQQAVLQEALSLSGLWPQDVTYIEAHGTGTPLGDPIEMQAIRAAYGDATSPMMIGSVKGNTGHLNAAAGLAGLVKTVGVLSRQRCPKTRNLETPNPALEIGEDRFVLDAEALGAAPINAAAVSSFGFGGTNVHLVLGRAPARVKAHRPLGLPVALPLSARTSDALGRLSETLAAYLAGYKPALGDVAHTLLTGRTAFAKRLAVVASDPAEAAAGLRKSQVLEPNGNHDSVVFVFPGQGSQFAGMGKALYDSQPFVKQSIDEMAELLLDQGEPDIRPLIFGQSDADLRPTDRTQLALFVVEYATASWLIARGLKPRAVLGHSVGEYVAATLAGVFTLRDTLHLIRVRGALIASLPAAGMLRLTASEAEVQALLPETLSLAVVNGPQRCVVSGTAEDLAAFSSDADAQGWSPHALDVSHGFHSHLLDPILDQFESAFDQVEMAQPQIPVLSNTTGGFADDKEIATPAYWRQHLRHTVRFGDNLNAVTQAYPKAQRLLIGPGVLSGTLPFIVSHISQGRDCVAALAQLWVDGHQVELLLQDVIGPGCRRQPLPGYPFERTTHMLPERGAAVASTADSTWIQTSVWSRLPDIAAQAVKDPITWFGAVPKELPKDIAQVAFGQTFAQTGPKRFTIGEAIESDLLKLREELSSGGFGHLVVAVDPANITQTCGLFGVLSRRVLQDPTVASLTLVTCSFSSIIATEAEEPDQGIAVGLLRCLALEHPHTNMVWLDVDSLPDAALLCRVVHMRTAAQQPYPLSLGLRSGHLWRRDMTACNLPQACRDDVLRKGACYVVAGGLGVVGRKLLRELAPFAGTLIIISRHADAALSHDPSRDPEIAQIIASGTAVQVVIGDNADDAAMSALSHDLKARGLRVAGVFNLAGAYTSDLVGDCASGLSARCAGKYSGTQVLAQRFAMHQPDFISVFSSVASETGGLGLASYVAANTAVNALADGADAVPVRVIAWDTWDAVGGGSVNEHTAGAIGEGQERITAASGFDKLWSVLAADLPYAVVSPVVLTSRIVAVAEASRSAQSRGAGPDKTAKLHNLTPGASAAVQMSQLLFCEVLGARDVCPGDDFLLLGGDSLSALRLLSRVRKLLDIEIAPAEFMAARTPEKLAGLMSDLPDLTRRARAYVQLQSMTPEQRDTLRHATYAS